MLINQRLDKTKIGKYKLMMLMMLKLMKMNNKNKVILLIKIGAPIQILVDKQIKNQNPEIVKRNKLKNKSL